MAFVEYFDNVHKINQSIIDEAYWCINNTENVYTDKSYPYYKTFKGGKLINDFTKEHFKFNHNSQIHIVYQGLPIHKDLMRENAFNYILDPGGDKVYTCFYEEDKKFIKEKYIIDSFRWHKIQTDVYHSVLNQSRPRIALTISSPVNLN